MINWLRNKLHNFIFPQDINEVVSSKHHRRNNLAITKGSHLDSRGMNFTIHMANGGYVLEYDENIQSDEGKTVPYYQRAEELVIQNQTTFNINGETRFISSITKYEDPDQSDKYLVFPKETIWA